MQWIRWIIKHILSFSHLTRERPPNAGRSFPFLLPSKSRFCAPLLTFFEAGPAYTGETPNEGREAMTTVYLDARFALDLAVNYCLLACAARLDGGAVRRRRLALAAGLGAGYGVLTLLPGRGLGPGTGRRSGPGVSAPGGAAGPLCRGGAGPAPAALPGGGGALRPAAGGAGGRGRLGRAVPTSVPVRPLPDPAFRRRGLPRPGGRRTSIGGRL